MTGKPSPHIAKQTSAAIVPRQTKTALLRARLTKPGGASLTEMMHLTGWQAHTLRAALTGLRKAGVVLTRRREGGETIYAIAQGALAHAPDGGVGRGTELAEASAGIDASVPAVPTVTPGGNAGNMIVDSGKGAA